MKKPKRYRWQVVGIFFAFMLLHQTDKLLIGPLKGPIGDIGSLRKQMAVRAANEKARQAA